MKNILPVINIILIFLVGYLYYLHFSNNKKPVMQNVQNTAGKDRKDGAAISYAVVC